MNDRRRYQHALTCLLPLSLWAVLVWPLAASRAPARRGDAHRVAALQRAPPVPSPWSRYRVLPAFDVPGTPAAFDRIGIVQHWLGPAERPPSAVLILVPGYLGGAEDFRYVGERLVQRLPWLQVWAVDRRNNFLANRSGMERAQAAGDARIAAAYYLAGQVLTGCPPHADPDPDVWNGPAREFALSQREAASLGMGKWGLRTELEDLRRLIAWAHARYPQATVFLGGHSLGGMTAQIYAGWRFGRTPATAGWHTIDGIVLIDGGVNGPDWKWVPIERYRRDHQMLESGRVYWDDLAVGASPLVGQLAEIAALAASTQPDAESFLWPSLPPAFQWADPLTAPTNKALFAAFSDNDRIGWLWRDGVPLELGREAAEANQFSTSVVALNTRGQLALVRLDAETNLPAAFRWTDGVSPPLGHLGVPGQSSAQSSAVAINDAGDVVGSSRTITGVMHAFLYQDGAGMVDLNTKLPPGSGWELYSASGINNRGQIIGAGSKGGFRLTPVYPMPGFLRP